jgi:pSer/pThr/pTyr-binding forkhead associated (FHA) protein
MSSPPMSGLASPGPMPAASPSIPNTTGRPRLTLVFNNQRYPVDKDKFIIGRGSTMTDLTIRDGNISRKHAAVIFRNGAYYIKDLDSTNGIDFKGNRIDSKRVEEGDLFTICDYEIRFTYQ